MLSRHDVILLKLIFKFQSLRCIKILLNYSYPISHFTNSITTRVILIKYVTPAVSIIHKIKFFLVGLFIELFT